MNRILFLSFWNPTQANPGKGVFIHEQASCLATTNINFVFVVVNIVNSKNKLLKITSDISDFEQGKKLQITISSALWKVIHQLPAISTFIVWREIKRMSLHQNVDIVHSNVVFPCGIVGAAISKKVNARFFISEHWSKVKNLASNPFWRQKIVNTYHSAEHVICVSEWLKDTVLSIAPNAKVDIVPNIVSSKFFYPKDRQDNRIEGCISFCCIASWQLPKRLDLILKSINEFAKSRTEHIILNVVGEGEQVSSICYDDLPSNLEIIKHGYLTKSKIGDTLRNSDYFMHASEIETFSIVVAEALTCGIPVIASNVGALPSLINKDNGVLCENSVDAWIEALIIITSKDFSSETIADGSKKFSPQHFIDSVLQLYSKHN